MRTMLRLQLHETLGTSGPLLGANVLYTFGGGCTKGPPTVKYLAMETLI